MSVTRLTYLHCDQCGEAWTPDVEPDESGTSQRADARKQGWRTNLPDGKDLCDECREDHDEGLDS